MREEARMSRPFFMLYRGPDDSYQLRNFGMCKATNVKITGLGVPPDMPAVDLDALGGHTSWFTIDGSRTPSEVLISCNEYDKPHRLALPEH
jgi:hypothetical protein